MRHASEPGPVAPPIELDHRIDQVLATAAKMRDVIPEELRRVGVRQRPELGYDALIDAKRAVRSWMHG
jgi:hypothetical protein